MIGAVNRSRVHLIAVQDHPLQMDPRAVDWSAPEFEASVHTNQNESRQGGKRSRVQFNWTKQGWCERDLRTSLVFDLSVVT